ncbi:MAG: 50S ribosomal protein L21 [Acidobacteriota bacterium]
MYALIEAGGKQYRVEPGDVIDIEMMAEVEDSVSFDRVLMVSDGSDVTVGTPVVDGAVVKASVVDQVRGPKIRVFKMKRRKGYRRTNGHRQNYLRVRIDDISA